MPGFLVGRRGDRVAEGELGRRERGGRVGGEARHLDHGVREARRHGGHRSDAHRVRGVLARVVHRREHHSRGAVGRRADLEQPERVGHHRAGQHLLLGDLLAVARVRVVQAVARVLHLHLGEVGVGGAVEVHAAAGVEREVGRVGGAEQAEPQPVGVVPSVAGHRREEALGRGVGADHQGDVAEPGEDAGASGVERGDPRCARGVAGGDPRAVPTERLGDGGGGDVARVAVADRLAARDELHVVPPDAGVVEGGQRRLDAVLMERPPPLPPLVHARPRAPQPTQEPWVMPSATHWSAGAARREAPGGLRGRGTPTTQRHHERCAAARRSSKDDDTRMGEARSAEEARP